MRQKSHMRIWAGVVAAVMLCTVLVGCMGDPLPWPRVRDFLLAWQGAITKRPPA